MKKLVAIAAVLPVFSLFGIVFPTIAQTRTTEPLSPQETVERLQTDLQFAVCRNDWNQAIDAINPLIGSDVIAADYREQLLRFRDRLQDWRSRGARFANLPNCGSATSTPPPVQTANFATAATNSTVANPLPAPPLVPLAGLSPATAIDLSTGSGTASGSVSTGQQVYSFNAAAGTQIMVDVNVTRVLPGRAFTDDDSQLFLFDSAGRLLAENDDDSESYQSMIGSVSLPSDGTYFVVITTFNNDPILDSSGVVTGWEGDGSSSIEYQITVTGFSPSVGAVDGE